MMKKLSSGPACRCFNTAAAACRFVSCPAIQGLPPVSTPKHIGVPVSQTDLSSIYRVPEDQLTHAVHPRAISFTKMELARNWFGPMIQSVNDGTKDFREVAAEVETALSKDPSKLEAVTGALKNFQEREWSDLSALVTFYEEVVYPIRMMHRQYKHHELNTYHMKDVLKRGLSAFKQDYLDEQAAALAIEKAEMEKCEAFIQKAVEEALTTDVCNDLVNVLRVVGERYEHSHAYAVKVLEDMNMMKIPFNEVTRELVAAISYNDGPYDDSDLLFELIECPERGEVSLEKGTLEAVSDKILKLMSKRHQTPLDDGVLLRSTATHPNLQRSPE